MADQQAVQSSGDAQAVAVPRCTMVAGPDDPFIGGVVPWRQDPDEKAISLKGPGLPSTNDENWARISVCK